MPALIAVLFVLAVIGVFVLRARTAERKTNELMDVAQEIRAAARRFGFRRQANIHPVETIDDPQLAIGAIATAFMEMDVLPTREQRDAMTEAFRYTLGLSPTDAQELAILGHWFVSECGGPLPAIPRLTRKLLKLQGDTAFPPLLEIVNATLSASSGAVNDQQKDALNEVKQIFRKS